MQLDQIVNLEHLEAEVRAGYINRRYHPEFRELAIVGYSDKCQYDNRWNETTRACRGIIYNTESSEVLARPFAKFFNYGQGDAQYDLDAPILGAFDKRDGSLGIAYRRPDGVWSIATRGSFDSEQARHANKLIEGPRWEFGGSDPLVTHLFEIIYPENRIVLDYGDTDDLLWLGSVDIVTGKYSQSGLESAPASTLREVLELPPRKNAEGWVVWLDALTAVKIKQADYVELHRIVSSLSVKEVWRQLRAGTFSEFAVALPDEFHEWVEATGQTLNFQFRAVHREAHRAFVSVMASPRPERKWQAQFIQAEVDKRLQGLVFQMLDGKDVTDSVWRLVEPKGTSVEVPTAELVGA